MEYKVKWQHGYLHSSVSVVNRWSLMVAHLIQQMWNLVYPRKLLWGPFVFVIHEWPTPGGRSRDTGAFIRWWLFDIPHYQVYLWSGTNAERPWCITIWGELWGMECNASKYNILTVSNLENHITKFYKLNNTILEHVHNATLAFCCTNPYISQTTSQSLQINVTVAWDLFIEISGNAPNNWSKQHISA